MYRYVSIFPQSLLNIYIFVVEFSKDSKGKKRKNKGMFDDEFDDFGGLDSKSSKKKK